MPHDDDDLARRREHLMHHGQCGSRILQMFQRADEKDEVEAPERGRCDLLDRSDHEMQGSHPLVTRCHCASSIDHSWRGIDPDTFGHQVQQAEKVKAAGTPYVENSRTYTAMADRPQVTETRVESASVP
jgi:hypothetical protein